MVKEDIKYWAALVGSTCIAILGAGVVPHPYDKWVMGISSVAGAIAAFQITPPSKS